MKRIDIIEKIGKDYLVSNIENEEFSYQKALKEIGKDIAEYQKEKGTIYQFTLGTRYSIFENIKKVDFQTEIDF